MLSPELTTLRLFLHVLAVSVWDGGQLVLAGLVPSLRREAPASLPVAARAFARVAWPAFAVAVITGVWNLAAVDVADTSTEYQVTLLVKLLVVALSGAGAAVHSVGRSRLALAARGAVGLVGALGAMFLGYLLTSGA